MNYCAANFAANVAGSIRKLRLYVIIAVLTAASAVFRSGTAFTAATAGFRLNMILVTVRISANVTEFNKTQGIALLICLQNPGFRRPATGKRTLNATPMKHHLIP